ncbi:D-glycero-alpha-D-manno-heptose-1,7-bisphosphate 7-phosphatase [Streptomyces sp. NPDC057654]|uniref:D-glycero-alpha-D-manno-heptose-1,7-bisphosphate 7-phosphatase n=1 Tax=Streptomyces sp. NPDC057654 TaxID=3346196 RepID=UPI0036C48D23
MTGQGPVTRAEGVPVLKAVLLDRDGVLNVNRPGYVRSAEDWEWLPGARIGYGLLAAAGLPMVVITNQSAVGRGLMTVDALDAVHARMTAGLAADGAAPPRVVYCPHAPETACACRKPRPGMVLRALGFTGTAPHETVLIGDHESDLRAAAAAGCRSLHVRSGRGALPPQPPPGCLGSVADLRAAAAMLVGSAGPYALPRV